MIDRPKEVSRIGDCWGVSRNSVTTSRLFRAVHRSGYPTLATNVNSCSAFAKTTVGRHAKTLSCDRRTLKTRSPPRREEVRLGVEVGLNRKAPGGACAQRCRL